MILVIVLKKSLIKRVIISKNMENLLQLAMVSDDNDLKTLRQLYDKTESTIRSLNGNGISEETYGTFLAPTIMAKLPQKGKFWSCYWTRSKT